MSPHVELGQRVGRYRARPISKARQEQLDTRTPVQRVYDFIVTYKKEHDGNSPTIREIGEACRISSTSVVVYWLKRLEDQELIRRPEPEFGNRYSVKIEVVGGCWTKKV